jgi:hypothetical protein
VMDAQEEHDYLMAKRLEKLRKEGKSIGGGSRKRLESQLKSKGAADAPDLCRDPIATAVANNPGLTPEKAAEIAEKFGF